MRQSRTYRPRARSAVRLWPALMLAALSSGCGGPQKGEASGGECFRDADCKEGLVCVDGECSSDVDSLVSVVEGPGTMTAAGGAGGATVTAAATATSSTTGMMGAGGAGAMGAGGAVAASTANAATSGGGTTDGGTTGGGTTDGGTTTGSGATSAGGAATVTATASETTGISGNAGAPGDP